ncbi:MAG: enoyl-CoA hydratase [Polyangiaceae bacterium]|nr:enoyl-CoA hydratase [Polyangiaceae bacterium]
MTHLSVEKNGPVTTVRFTRPEKKNALDLAMYEAWAAAFEEAATDDAVRVVVLTGSAGIFTAGNDIGDFMRNPPTGESSPVFRVLTAVRTFPKPIVAAVDGPAIGIGTTILLHCDLVIATESARFQLPFVNLALVPEAASSVLLPSLVGMHRAAEWLMLGEAFDARAALVAGLVNRVVTADALEPTAQDLAARLAQKPKEALRLTKKLLRGPTSAQVEQTMRDESALFLERLASAEAMEAFMAFASRKSK